MKIILTVLTVLVLLTPTWSQHDRQLTGPEITAFTKAIQKLKEDCTDPTAWAVVKETPRDYVLQEMISILPNIRTYPILYQQMRQHVSSIPGWDQWVFAKMEEHRKVAEAQDPKVDWSKPCRLLFHYHEFLSAVADEKAVALMAPYLNSSVIGLQSQTPRFPRETPRKLFLMQIPGAPDSRDITEWRQWWKENEALYRAGKGPKPTRYPGQPGEPPVPGKRKPFADAAQSALAGVAVATQNPASASEPGSGGLRYAPTYAAILMAVALVVFYLWTRRRQHP